MRPGGGFGCELSPRQKEVAALIVEGLTEREIGARLFISGRTVETHKRGILLKLGARNGRDIVRILLSQEHKQA